MSGNPRADGVVGMTHTTVSEKEAWADQTHARVFDYMHAMPKFILKKHYESFNEGKLLAAYESRISGSRFFEIGCATGELYRYLSNYRRRFDYTGFDISRPAIERARHKYPEGRFHQLTGGFPEIRETFGQPDVVWCRDVVLHQTDPYGFLGDLIDLANEAVFLRLRTRDVGATEVRSEISCQLHWDRYWVPYIVMNTDEMIARVASRPDVRRIVVARAYEVLGGQNFRFLPKDLYFSSARTAETALYVEKGTAARTEVLFMDRPQSDRPKYTLLERAIRKFYSHL